jgi:hypothetical protein
MLLGEAEQLMEILRLLERATQPLAYDERLSERTVVEFHQDRKKLIDHLWVMYDNLSIEYSTKEST